MDLIHPGIEDRIAPRSISPRVASLHGKHIVMVDNSHHNVDLVMERLAGHLGRRYDVAVTHLRKHSANSPATDDLLRAATEAGDVVVNGVAD